MTMGNIQSVPYLDLPAQISGIRSEVDAAIKNVIDKCAFCLGPEVTAFEKEFAAWCGMKHAVAVNSGTSALHLAMKVLGVKAGDEVITTPFTFVATSWAISYVGARPVYVDIDDATFNIDPRLVAKAVTSRTKAMIPVHLYGQPCDIDALMDIAKKNDFPVVEDCAQSHGAEYKGKKAGSFGAVSCYSFYPGKNLGAFGEGGMFVTNDESLAEHARVLRDHGSRVRYFHDEVGFNYRMEGMQAAVLRVKLRHIDDWTDKRRKVAAKYHQMLAGLPLKLPKEAPYAKSVYHLYVIRSDRRDALKKHLDQKGVGNGLHYPVPLHMQKCYANLGYKEGDFPVAERAGRECISLPVFPEMTDEQIEYVAGNVAGFFG